LKPIYDPDFKTIFVVGVVGGWRPGWFEYVFYDVEIRPEKAYPRPGEFDGSKVDTQIVFKARIILNPIQAKVLLRILQQHIREYERRVHPIPEPEGGDLERWR